MGKKCYKKLCKEYSDFICDAFDSATSSLELSTRVIDGWVAKAGDLSKSKRHGLSKRETAAAFKGFALGVANGADAVVRGEPFGDEDDDDIIEWLLSNVAHKRSEERPSDDSGDSEDAERIDVDLGALGDLIELLLGTDGESE